MSEIARYRELQRLVGIEQRAAERDLAEVMAKKRDLKARIGSHLAAARAAGDPLESPSAGELRLAAAAGAAMRARAAQCRQEIEDLTPEIEKRHAALSAVMRKATAVEDLIARLEREEAMRAEEREDEATLAVTQMRDAE